jgi:hypothetical protein
MFEQSADSVEKDRSRLIIVASAIAVLIVIALAIVLSQNRSRQPSIESQMSRAGSPDFDSYAPFVKVTDVQRMTSSTLIGRRLGILKANVENSGDRTLTALQIRAAAVGLSGELLIQKIALPVPRQRDTLGPGETMAISVQIDPIPDPDKIMDMTLEVYGIKLK